MSTRHEPPPATRGYGTAPTVTPGLLVEHGPLRAAHGHGLVTAATPGLSTRHGPLHATCNRGPTIAARLQWTCGLDSSVGGQR